MVNLEWYRTFKAIYQYGTLTKAAEELLISQPNVSIQLSSLETYIGQALFIRLPRKMEPTEYGKRLYTQIVESIDNLEKVETEFKKTVLSKTPTLRLGTPSELFVNYIARRADLLKWHLEVSYGLSDDLTKMLETNKLDIAIITKQFHTDVQLTYEPIFTENFMIVCRTGFNTSEFDKLAETNNLKEIEDWLKKQTWYAYDNNLSLIRRFWKENFKKRPILTPHITVPDNNALLEAVAETNALVMTSDLIAGRALQEGKIKIVWRGNAKAQNTIYLAYNKNKILSKQAAEMKQLIHIGLEVLNKE